MITAFIFYLIGINQFSLNGDEYNSINEAQQLGTNWNSFLYFILLNIWMRISVADVWLKLLSVLLSVGTVGWVYFGALHLIGRRQAGVAAILATTSPFIFFHTQEVRFYSLFIFCTAFYLAMSLYWRINGSKKTILPWVIISAILLILSHFLGILVVLTQVLVLWSSNENSKKRWKRIFFSMAMMIGLFSLPIIPFIQHTFWQLYQHIGNVTVVETPQIISISFINVIKMVFGLYVFIFGYHVYPLQLFFVIPGILILVSLFLIGCWTIIRKGNWGAIPILYSFLLVLIYVLLDSVGGRLAGGVAPRHAAFYVPVLILILTSGIFSLPRNWINLGIFALVIINLIAIGMRWCGDWSYGEMKDFRKSAKFSEQNLEKVDLLLIDGRSFGPVNRYFFITSRITAIWDFQNNVHTENHDHSRLLLMTNDYQPERRRDFNELIHQIDEEYDFIKGNVDYPVFQYVYEQKPDSNAGFKIDPATGQLNIPLSIYGLEFQDLKLPIGIKFDNNPITIDGATIVPDLNDQQSISIPLAEESDAEQIILISSIIDKAGLENGDAVAELRITGSDGEIKTIPLRMGIELHAWDDTCTQNTSCETIYQWHKRAAILGQKAYPQAWDDFQAGIHAVRLNLDQRMAVSQIDISWLSDQGKLAIWTILLTK